MTDDYFASTFGTLLLEWYRENPRELPWKATRDPYKIWLSEIILQQTQVIQGIPYYNKFVGKYPDVHALASATEDEVLNDWQGLGYNSRARNLHKAAISVVEDHGGIFPGDYEGLRALSGIGPYTAAAIASFAYGEPTPVVDANVIRILCRVLGIEEEPSRAHVRRRMSEFLDDAISGTDPADFNQAIMNFGALVCKPSAPKCDICPFQDHCYALKNDMVGRLPVKKTKKPRRQRYFHYLTLTNESGLYLRKRELKDIWQGMYELPLIETPTADSPDHDALIQALKGFGVQNYLLGHDVYEDTQVLSHQKDLLFVL